MIYEEEVAEATEGETSDAGSIEVADTAESSATEEAASTEVAPETSSEPQTSSTDFDFTGWDGSAEALPQHYRPIHETVSKHLRDEVEDLRSSLKQDREFYQALLEGEDLGQEFQAKLQAAEKELQGLKGGQETWQTDREKMEAELKQFRDQAAQSKAAEQAEAKKWVQEFQVEHQDIISNEASKQQLVALLDAGIGPTTAAALTREGNTDLINAVVGYIQQGVPEEHSLRLALADIGRHKTEAAKPRAAARITAGASEAANVPDSAEKAVSDKTFNIRDARRLAVNRAFKRRVG